MRKRVNSKVMNEGYNFLEYIKEVIAKQELQNKTTLNLMPIENFLSHQAMNLLSTDCVNRYSLPNTERSVNAGWYAPGEKGLVMLETEINKKLSKLFGIKYITTRPLSGIDAMEIVLTALCGPNKKILSVAKHDGGHSATAKIAKSLGYNHSYLPFKKVDMPCIDYEKLKILCKNNPIDLVYLDLSCILFPVDLKRLRRVLRDKTIICYDGSHVLGLIANGFFQNPLKDGADIVCGSFHKSFFGPQRGLVATNSKEQWLKIKDVAETKISNRHCNDLAALGASVAEMIAFGKEYSKQLLTNSRELAKQLEKYGFTVARKNNSRTKSHQIWVRLDNDDAKKFVISAFKSGLILNSYLLPGSDMPGLRLGVQGITRRGMQKKEMKTIALILSKIKNQDFKEAREIINEINQRFNTIKFSYESNNV